MKKRKLPKRTKELIDQRLKASDELAMLFCIQLGIDYSPDYIWWLDDSHDNLAIQCAEQFVNMEEIVLTLEYGLTYDEFDQWYWQWNDFDLETYERKPERINLRSWCMGARPKEQANEQQ